jgi:hypothetical protein
MTLRYVQVTHDDLQREFHAARFKLQANRIPFLLIPTTTEPDYNAGMPAVFQSMATSRHLLEMYRRQLPDGKLRRKIEHLANHLLKVTAELETFFPAEK